MMALLALVACSNALEEGVRAFDAGHLDEAIASWEAAGPHRSGVVSYDLGVAYYRAGDLPRSVAALRAAARLRPRDENVQHNLALARSGIEGAPTPVGQPAWSLVLTAGEVGLAGVLVTALGSAILLLGRGRAGGAAVLTGGLVIGIFGAVSANDQHQHPVGVVVDAEAVLRDAASINSGERLRLPPGTEVRVERRLGDFVLVQDGRGRRGWAPANAVLSAW